MSEISPAVGVPATTEPVESGPALLRPLRIRDFRFLFAGETVSVSPGR